MPADNRTEETNTANKVLKAYSLTGAFKPTFLLYHFPTTNKHNGAGDNKPFATDSSLLSWGRPTFLAFSLVC